MDVPERQASLGGALRSVRLKNRWTLKAMSARTGIPLSTISKVEHNRATLSYDRLVLLSQRLNLELSELLAQAGAKAEPVVTARRSLGRVDAAVCVSTTGYDHYYLCPELRKKRMIPVLTCIRSGARDASSCVPYSGEEFVYVLQGSIQVLTEFYEAVTLRVGESIYLDSSMGPSYATAQGCREALVLRLCSGADESLMESLPPVS